MALASSRGIKVIEDCAQAHGAAIGDSPVGSFGDAAVFSFCQDKIISTGGEGGLALFKDPEAYRWAWSYKDHGKDRAKVDRPQAEPGFKWVHDGIGTNWRMLELSAAIGLVQLDKLERWRAARTRNAAIWAEALGQVEGLRMPAPPPGFTGAYYKAYAHLEPRTDRSAGLRGRIIAEARQRGIPVFSGSCPEIYREKAFSDLRVAPLTVAPELGDTALMFEVHPTLDPDLLRQRASAVAAIAADVLRQDGGE
jgi:dTDP-4-amino-4,6-dideoxygalactose transaminase